MTLRSPRTLHLLCTLTLVVAFLSVAVGGWALANDSGEGGANIGAGGLMVIGSLLGLIGIAVGAAALVVRSVQRRRSRS